ncbi:alpha/beta hydrolase family protein [Rubripirellula reticaptiva]|uniref:Alpha/beta hydrolase family protein n=1 Tax=Rubripirellula reticaptiva TaxID=2528013 RepID=A0A5C6F683_9BACT|nr:dienelactone hydrolase [Rubripirellula reticaptiva]TWU55576.1 Alpha/beta hydrolase family protein [Rubripirellula reticaptiva]
MNIDHAQAKRFSILIIVLSMLIDIAAAAQTLDYDPSVSLGAVVIEDDQFTYDDRDVPIRIYLPESTVASPVLLFSHGLGGSREGGTYLGKHWAGRGYTVVALQHAGSDVEVIKNAPRLKMMQTLQLAASAANAQFRYSDVKATLDYLEKQNNTNGKYAGRFDMTKIGMSGHSFGAVTTQAVSGQSYKFQGQKHTDQRIDAAIAFSPSVPTYGHDENTFSKVSIPWMLMTGTKDDARFGRNLDAKSRRKVFQGLPSSGHFYELVLHDAEHAAFADQRGGRTSARNPNHHKAITALSTAFWDAYLRGDEKAKSWLNNSGARTALEPNDQWQRK